MNKLLIEYLLFLGMGLYAITAGMFLYLFLRTLRTRDGIGLIFLKVVTFGIFLGSLVVAVTRFAALYITGYDPNIGRIIAIINPLTLFGVGLYLNYLFRQKYKK